MTGSAFGPLVTAYIEFPKDEKDREVDALKFIKKGFPPAVVFFGTTDPWKKGWDALHGRLKEAGNTTTDLQLAEGLGHGFFNRDPWQTVTLIAADRFLVQHGFLRGEPTLTAPKAGERLTAAIKPKGN
jgi:acetyl esterase/lipase